MSLVAMARATSTTTMPTPRVVKSTFGGLLPIAILPSRAYPAASPETTALWYSALTSTFPSVAGVVMALFYLVGVGASLQLGGLSWTLGAGPAATDVGLARKRMFPRAKPAKTYASEPPARQATMIHWLCSGRLSVRSLSASFGEADVPSTGRNDSLAA